MIWSAIGAALMALAVILGAFGAHALKDRLDAYSLDIELIRRSAPDQSTNQKNRGGHPPQYSWDTVRLAILVHANLNRFDTRIELLKFANDFIAQWPQQPTERAIRQFLKPIAEAMGLA